MAGKLDGSKAIQSGTITTTQLATALNDTITAGGGPKIQSLIYPGDDTAANTIGGQTIYITGSGFDSNVAVYVNGDAVPSVTYISASNVGFTTPALSAATYPVYVTNPDDGATAILVPGMLVSGEPSWVTGATLSEQDASSAWNISLSATGDAPLTYALASGSSLPGGISLASNGVISGTITTPPETNTTYNFTVDAIDAQNQSSSRAFSVTASTGEGVLFANNVLLLHADGTNNGTNHSFLDSSNNNFTITRNGNATQGSFSPFSQTGWSNYFDGSGDYISTSAGAANGLGAGDFTIEVWLYYNAISGYQRVFCQGSTGSGECLFLTNPDGSADFCFATTSILNFPAGTFTAGVWTHVAIVRSGSGSNNLKGYKNGVSVATGTNTQNFNATSSTHIGLQPSVSNQPFAGYVSNYRVVKGTAVYTSNFTPPTSPLTAITNTSVLTCQSNRFIDNSTNALTITRNGDTSIQPWSPFAPSTAYSTSAVGGSGYFDGTGDYLTIPGTSEFAFGTGAWTVEFWVYPFAYGGSLVGSQLFGTVNGAQSGYSINLGQDINTFRIISNATGTWADNLTVSSGGGPLLNTWSHMAVSRDGANISIYKNGSRVATSSSAASWNFTGTNGVVGRFNDGTTTREFSGYLSGLRVIKGSAAYDPTQTTITVPTSPPTNVANTTALLNFTNAQIFDQTAKNVLECVGDAKVSTAQYKYGTASMYFDGTGDYLIGLYNPMYDLGAADFTIEFWMYPTAVGQSSVTYIFYIGSSGNYAPILIGQAASGYGIVLYSSSSGSAWNLASGSSFGTATANAWNHVALVRNGSNVYLCLNGTITTTLNWGTTALLSSSSNRPNIGSATGVSNTFYTGYIDDLRITRGYARYTANFTAPTAKFKDK